MQIPESVDCTECVRHELRVALGFDEDALPVLQVDDLECGFGDDHAIPGAKTSRNHMAEIQALLDEHLRITTGFLRDGDAFLDERHIVVREVFHLVINPS